MHSVGFIIKINPMYKNKINNMENKMILRLLQTLIKTTYALSGIDIKTPNLVKLT